ncbi:hypothetical protein GGX14DRAFT_393366 [Mycena pura]|uniref:Uncharacterized protein n=1 Tax=Mycena pura TaxID=153505 RepID=A0AAD6YIU0_9AGAR|nr:hypothetical protein GGX14DRAFT_393366 [Mycena pura]
MVIRHHVVCGVRVRAVGAAHVAVPRARRGHGRGPVHAAAAALPYGGRKHRIRPPPGAIFLHHVRRERQHMPSVVGSGAQPSATVPAASASASAASGSAAGSPLSSGRAGRGVHTGTPGWIQLGSQLDPGWSWSQAEPICSLIWGPAEASRAGQASVIASSLMPWFFTEP